MSKVEPYYTFPGGATILDIEALRLRGQGGNSGRSG